MLFCNINKISDGYIVFLFLFCFIDEEQQKNCHTGQGGEHQEEALSGVPTKHRQTAQAGDICGHQEEVQKGNQLLALLISLSNIFLSNHDIFFPPR